MLAAVQARCLAYVTEHGLLQRRYRWTADAQGARVVGRWGTLGRNPGGPTTLGHPPACRCTSCKSGPPRPCQALSGSQRPTICPPAPARHGHVPCPRRSFSTPTPLTAAACSSRDRPSVILPRTGPPPAPFISNTTRPSRAWLPLTFLARRQSRPVSAQRQAGAPALVVLTKTTTKTSCVAAEVTIEDCHSQARDEGCRLDSVGHDCQWGGSD